MRLVDGRFTCRLQPPPPAPPTIIPAASRGAPVIPSAAAAAAPAWDLSQQMVQLAILMLLDLGTLKGALYKGEILAAGGVVVLTARLADKGSHDQVSAAGGAALALFFYPLDIKAPSLSACMITAVPLACPRSPPPLPLHSGSNLTLLTSRHPPSSPS